MDSEVQAYEAPPLPDPAIASPQSSTISGSTVTFGWSNNGNTVDRWWLDIGTSQGGGEIHEGVKGGPKVQHRADEKCGMWLRFSVFTALGQFISFDGHLSIPMALL